MRAGPCLLVTMLSLHLPSSAPAHREYSVLLASMEGDSQERSRKIFFKILKHQWRIKSDNKDGVLVYDTHKKRDDSATAGVILVGTSFHRRKIWTLGKGMKPHASWNKVSHEKSCCWSQEGGTVNRVLCLPVLGHRGKGVMTRGG